MLSLSRALRIGLAALFLISGKLPTNASPLASGHVPEIARRLRPFGILPATTNLNLAIGLPLRHKDELATVLTQLYDPASPLYRHFFTPDEFAARFGPTEGDYQSLLEFARTNHLKVTGIHPNRMLLDVVGKAGDIEHAFNISLRTYRHPKEDRDFFTPDTEPSVAAGIPILDVAGLNNFALPHPLLRNFLSPKSLSKAAPRAGSGSSGSYLGHDFRAAYVPNVALDGSGQSVGLLQFDGFYASDITSYLRLAALGNIPIHTVLLDGYNGVPTPGTNNSNGEVSLDIEMVVSMAPGLAQVIVYEAGPAGIPNDILNRMATDNQAKQLSCSWGWGGGPSATTDQIFQQMAAQGQSFFCASGDTGAYAAGAIDNASQPNAPSDSPYITVVGGTTLTTTGPGGAWVSEQVWNWGGGTASSGGISSYYSIPSWQQGVSMSANGGSTGRRNIPDVALTADNVEVVYANGRTAVFGGTSCAAPLWAGFMALVNQQAAGYGLPPVGFINPAIYNLGRNANYGSSFHDITSGNNINGGSPNAFPAVAGYDLCTGWGTPKASLIDALAPRPDPMAILPGNGFSSSRLIGWPFSVAAKSFALTNSGDSPLSWSLGNTSVWFTALPANGTLWPGGTSAVVDVSLTAAAYNLGPGTYNAWLWFTNLTSGGVQSRQFSLQVTAQLVQNGGFEPGNFSGWAQSGNTGYSSVLANSTYAHSGADGAQFGPSGSLGYLSQTVPVIPGQLYRLSFWLNNPKAGNPNEFLVSWNGTLLFDQTNLPALGWTNLQFFATASGTSAALRFGFRNDPAYFGFDDVSVLPVVPPTLQWVSSLGRTVRFAGNTMTDLVYQAQYATNKFPAIWLDLGAASTATNSSTIFTDPNPPDLQRFYRIVVRP